MNKTQFTIIAIWLVLAITNIVSLFTGTSLFFTITNIMFGVMNIPAIISLAMMLVQDRKMKKKNEKLQLQEES